MLVVVKMPHTKFTIEGSIPKKIIDFVKEEYGNKAQIISNKNYINVSATSWYKKMKSQSHPGRVLRVYRQNADLTQQVMADIIGVSSARVSDFENGRRSMSKEIIKKVSKYFNVPVERLL